MSGNVVDWRLVAKGARSALLRQRREIDELRTRLERLDAHAKETVDYLDGASSLEAVYINARPFPWSGDDISFADVMKLYASLGSFRVPVAVNWFLPDQTDSGTLYPSDDPLPFVRGMSFGFDTVVSP